MERVHIYRAGDERRQIIVPEIATRAVVYMRHAPSVQDGKKRPDRADESRTLTKDGEEMARACRRSYAALIRFLEGVFNKKERDSTVYLWSGWPRTLLTLFLATGAEQIERDERLRLKVLIGLIQNGEWRKARKAEGWTKGQMIEHLLTPTCMELWWASQPIVEALDEQRALIEHGRRGERLTIMCGHEDMISIMAGYICPRAFLLEGQLGIKECQALIFFLDKSGRIVGAHRFEPTPTLAMSDID